MPSVVDTWAQESLNALERHQLRRFLEPVESPSGPRLQVAGRTLLNFSSNDYLGLASHPEVVEAGRAALLRHGLGTGASRLVVGDTEAHRSLERALAKFEGTESALLFNSGYAANVGALQALMGPGDVVFSDALNHASLIDGCRLSRAKVVVYPHGDVEALEALVRQHAGRRRLVVTDTVFSMDGDRAPVKAIAELCERHGLGLMVDEAHATGVLGATGRGLCELEGVKADVHVGTLSKALGAFGAYVCGSKALTELLLNQARSLVFSTALPAAVCAAAETSLRLLQGPELRERLWARITQFSPSPCESGERVGVRGHPAASAIFSIVLGAPEAALAASTKLRDAGILVKAIRPPTVPEGTSRLRIALSAGHTEKDVETLLRALRSIAAAAPHPDPLPAFAGRGSDVTS